MGIQTVRKGIRFRAFNNRVPGITLKRKREAINGQRMVHSGELRVHQLSFAVSTKK